MTSRSRVVGRLVKLPGGWAIETRPGERTGVKPKWKNRGQVRDRMLLWYLFPPDKAGQPRPAMVAREQPFELLALQPDGHFPGGLYASDPPKDREAGRQVLPEDEADAFERERERGNVTFAGSRPKVPDPGSQSVPDDRAPSRSVRAYRGGLPGLGKRR